MQAQLSAKGVSVRFGSLQALDQISLDFFPGQIHAVLGENGAGKSTLMNVLGGFLRPDSGSVHVQGRLLASGSAQAAKEAGIGFVHQHFMLVPALSALENIALSRLGSSKLAFDLSQLRAEVDEVLKVLGWQVPLDQEVRNLSVGVRQRIEIVKALLGDSKILILDEPTAVLNEAEVDELFETLRRLRDRGVCILLIAHKLQEIVRIADVVSVLRAGKRVATAPISEASLDQIADWMIGTRLQESAKSQPTEFGEVVLTVQGLSVPSLDSRKLVIDGIHFQVREKEILGIGGVDGNGQQELAEALVGVRMFSGSIESVGRVGYIPQDRQRDGLALDFSVFENYLIASHDSGSWILRERELLDQSEKLVKEFDVKTQSLRAPMRSLSGGNQQKVIVGRTLALEPKVLVVLNPTRGLDFRATQFVQASVIKAAQNGAAVVLITTDRDELERLAHQKLYLSAGKLYESELALVGAQT